MCSVKADLSKLCTPKTLWRRRDTGACYWRLQYEVELQFGLTELKARLKWDEGVSSLSHISCMRMTDGLTS